MKHQIMTVMLDAFLIILMHFPLSFFKNAPPTFSTVHLLHRLHTVGYEQWRDRQTHTVIVLCMLTSSKCLLSLTYKALTTAQRTYLHSLISVQPPRATRSSSVVTLSRPPTSSSPRIINRSFSLRITSSLESTSCLISPALHKTPC